jgi:hypothetical protein
VATPQILYQSMNGITLYMVVLSEVMNRAGPSVVSDYASFFKAASVLIIVVMLAFVGYFDIWASSFLQEHVFQPVVGNLRARLAVGHAPSFLIVCYFRPILMYPHPSFVNDVRLSTCSNRS